MFPGAVTNSKATLSPAIPGRGPSGSQQKGWFLGRDEGQEPPDGCSGGCRLYGEGREAGSSIRV